MAGDPGYTPEGSKSLDVTGIFCVSCRHIFICPNGVIDFHKGERYRYADVCFAGPLNYSYAAGLRYFVITYDIACKYGINFKSRCCDSSCKFVLIPTGQGDINIVFCVNKFHQESHDEGCAAKNSLNYTKSAYTRSVQSLDMVISELDDLKTSLGAETTAELEAEYLSAGGEQFLQDPNRLRWLSQKDLARQMQDAESKTSGIVRGSLGSAKVADVDLMCKALNLEAMQARLRQRKDDLAKSSNPTPGLRGRIVELTKQVTAGLEKHYSLLSIVAPQLNSLASKAKDPSADVILLPSRLTPEEVEHLGLAKLLAVELQLRVGQAYDLVVKLRDALALQSFWTRHVKSQNSNQKTTRRVSGLRSSVARVTEAVRAYDTCYKWLAKRAPDMAKRFGLHPVQRSDLVLLSAWRDSKGYKRTNSRLPWIWTLRPLTRSDLDIEIMDDSEKNSDSLAARSTLEQVVDEWKNEFIRLDFVHAIAATERWTEEVRILECEMRATYLSLRNTALMWAKRGNDMDAPQACDGDAPPMYDDQWFAMSPEVRGYAAYASRQTALYIGLAQDASEQFGEVVGKDRWKDI
ncbi:hypothetical protein FRC01_006645 [Tulasnella sp. 417]|nr:hypothetical protein FRC01_006645 [Tulasnella sp. 417]